MSSLRGPFSASKEASELEDDAHGTTWTLRELSAVAEASRAFAEAGGDVEAIQQLFAARVTAHVGDGCALRLISDDGHAYALPAVDHRDACARALMRDISRDGVPASPHDGLAALLDETRVSLVLNHFDASPYVTDSVGPFRALLDRYPPRHLLCAPVQTRARFFGNVIALRHDAALPFGDADERLLAELASRAALALDLARQCEEHRRQRARLEAILAQLPVAVAVLEPSSDRALLVNDAFAHAFPTATIALRRPIDDVTPLDAEALAPLQRALRAGQSPSGEALHVARADGAVVDLRANASPVHIDGHIVASIVLFTDITQETRAQAELFREALDATRLRDEFLTVAAHELRTPLTSLSLLVSGLVRALERGTLVPLAPDRLRRAEEQVQKLVRLVHQLVDVSRIAAGRLVLDLAPTDLGVLCHGVIGRHRHAAQLADCELLSEVRGHGTGLWDARRLEQVIASLLEDALRHRTGKRILVEAATSPEGARLRIADATDVTSGMRRRLAAMPPMSVALPSMGSMGLGLWVAQHIVEAHGGVLRQVSGPEGVGVVVELPHTAAHTSSASPLQAAAMRTSEHRALPPQR